MEPTRDEVHQELERLAQAHVLAPQERTLLQRIVQLTLEKHTARLYQKGLADDLRIDNAKQIGVLATRIRSKLIEHYRHRRPQALLEVHLGHRGYEARFVYRHAQRTLDDATMLLVANARGALDQRTLPAIAEALRYLERALVESPAHPLLLSLKAQCLATRALYGVYPLTDLKAAESLIQTIGGGTTLPWEYWLVDASVRMALHWDWSGADASFSQAIALSNGDARFSAWHTALLSSQGRTREAVEHLMLAVNRAPDSPIVRADLAINQIYAGYFDAAEDTIRSSLALFGPRAHYLLHVHQAILHEARGDSRKAALAIAAVPLKWPKTAITLGLRALFCGLNGQHRTARWHMSKLQGIRLVAGARVPAIHLAVATLGAGDPDGAVVWLRRACVIERDPNAVLSNVYPFFRHLYRHRGFTDLIVDTMKLPLRN